MQYKKDGILQIKYRNVTIMTVTEASSCSSVEAFVLAARSLARFKYTMEKINETLIGIIGKPVIDVHTIINKCCFNLDDSVKHIILATAVSIATIPGMIQTAISDSFFVG